MGNVAYTRPYFLFGHNILKTINITDFLKWAIILAGLGHFLILVASFQVPKRLNWKEEFSSLGRFNRKIFWTYGGYIVFCIISFGIVNLLNVEGLIEVNKSSLFIALFISLFWTVRVIVDFSYFKHTDWPPGDEFIIGHTCLTALFSFSNYSLGFSIMATECNIDENQRLKNHGLIFYDGECGFCQFWIQFLLKRDHKNYFLFTPLQGKLALKYIESPMQF